MVFGSSQISKNHSGHKFRLNAEQRNENCAFGVKYFNEILQTFALLNIFIDSPSFYGRKFCNFTAVEG